MKLLKKIAITTLIPIIILIFKELPILSQGNLADYIVLLLNTYSVDKLIDIFSMIVYTLPITLWTTIIVFKVNGYYENFNFLVTRLGGHIAFNKKILINIFKETLFLLMATYIILIVFVIIITRPAEYNISLILLSFIINYSVVIILTLLFITLRIYNKFSLAFTLTYLMEISLFVTGLFLKYMQINIFIIKNPFINTILIFSGETYKIDFSSLKIILIIHLLIIISITTLYNFLLNKRREIND